MIRRAMLGILCLALGANGSEAQGLTFTGVRVFDGERVMEGVTVNVSGGLIEAVGPDVEPLAGASRVEGKGGTLMPGLIELRWRVEKGEEPAIAGEAGVTTLVEGSRLTIPVTRVETQRDFRHAIGKGARGVMRVFCDGAPETATIEAAMRAHVFVVPALAAHGGCAHGRAAVTRMHAAGIAILAGSDAGERSTIHRELELLVEAGLTPREALEAATRIPAREAGLDDRGRIAPGMRADMILVEGDPLADITKIRSLRGIWKSGHAVERGRPEKNPPGR